MADPAAQLWEAAGWQSPVVWTARDGDGDPLRLSLRWPHGWSATDLSTAAEGRPGSPLAQWAGQPGAIAAGRWVRELAREQAAPYRLIATLTVMLTDQPVAGAEFAGATRCRIDHREALRMRSVRAAGGLDVLIVSYLIPAAAATLAVTFGAPQPPFHASLERMFDDIARTLAMTEGESA